MRKVRDCIYDKRNGQPSDAGDLKHFKMVTSLTIRNHCFGGFLVNRTVYQGSPDMNHKIWNIVSTEIYTPYQVMKEYCYI